MPGPAKWRTQYLVDHMLASRKITQRQLDSRVENVLDWAQKLARMSPDVIYGDDIETTRDNPEDRAILRKVATAAVVLLKNEGGVLPIRKGVKSIAVIGPRAVAKSVFGGGSAQLNTSYVVTVLEGLQEGAPKEVSVQYSLGTPGQYGPKTCLRIG